MSVVVTRKLRPGTQVSTNAATGDPFLTGLGVPDVYGHVTRTRWRVRWLITAGKNGRVLSGGTAWTRGGAWVAAVAASHAPSLFQPRVIRKAGARYLEAVDRG